MGIAILVTIGRISTDQNQVKLNLVLLMPKREFLCVVKPQVNVGDKQYLEHLKLHGVRLNYERKVWE